MKFLTLMLLTAVTVQAHCKPPPHHPHTPPDPLASFNNTTDKFPRMIVNGKPETADWQAVRRTKTTNSRDNGGVSSVNSDDIRCFGGSPGKATLTVGAGETLGFVASSGIMHFGPCQFYMARVPDDKDINTWEATGNVWFKAGSIGAVQNGGPLSGTEAIWPAYRESSFNLPVRFPPHPPKYLSGVCGGRGGGGA